jgi:hypothetical protein
MEHARLDRVQHLGHQPKEPEVRRAIARCPVAVKARAAFVFVSPSKRSLRSSWSARPFMAVA